MPVTHALSHARDPCLILLTESDAWIVGCQDPDSSGCDLDMLDQMRANEARAGEVSSPEYRWSAEIDDAVFKTD